MEKNHALATRELPTIANKTALRAIFLVTSDEYRQPSNKPDSFENDPSPLVYDWIHGDKHKYARPTFVKKGCQKYHGNPEDTPPAVTEKHGNKKAFGYNVGDDYTMLSIY